MFAKGMYVTIEGQYAEPLGYKKCVGGSGVINGVMKALNSVTILTAPDSALIGKEIDIHVEDCKLEEPEKPSKLYAVYDFKDKRVYYTKLRHYFEFVRDRLSIDRKVRLLDGAKYPHHLIDSMDQLYPGVDFNLISLDDMVQEEGIDWAKRYSASYPEQAQKFKNPPKMHFPKKKGKTLTDMLIEQMKMMNEANKEDR